MAFDFTTKLSEVFQSTFNLKAPVVGSLNPIKPYKRSRFNKAFGDRIGAERFSPDALQQTADEYLSNIGLGEEVSFSADAFDNHVKGRVKDFLGLKEAKTPAGALIHTKLSEDPKDNDDKKAAIIAVQEALTDVLNPTPPNTFKKAQDDYKESVATFKDLSKKNSRGISSPRPY